MTFPRLSDLEHLAKRAGEILRGEMRTRGEGFLAEVREAAEARRMELTDRLQSLRAPRAGSTELS